MTGVPAEVPGHPGLVILNSNSNFQFTYSEAEQTIDFRTDDSGRVTKALAPSHCRPGETAERIRHGAELRSLYIRAKRELPIA